MDLKSPWPLFQPALEFIAAARVIVTTIVVIMHFDFLKFIELPITAPTTMVTIKHFAAAEVVLEVVVWQTRLHALIQILNFLLRKSRSSYFFLS